MKDKYVILLVLCLFSQIIAENDETGKFSYSVLHQNAEMAKICQLKDGKVLAVSSTVKSQMSKVTKFDKNAIPEYNYFNLSAGYTSSAQIAESKDPSKTESEYYLFGHNKQDIAGQSPNENILKFKDNQGSPGVKVIKSYLYKTHSIISLKSGRVIVVGIKPISTFGAETKVEINLYNPISNTFENTGESFIAYSNLVSCFEQKENDLYCAYVSQENLFVNKLALKHFTVQNNVIEVKEDLEVIKNFYTVFNFIKAIRYNEREALILFQSGDPSFDESLYPYGNSGKDLYFYHYSTYDHSVLRYEYLFNGCLFKGPDYYNADIIVLSNNRVYAACEFGENSIRGFSIVMGSKLIESWKFEDFKSNSLKYPVFGIFDKTLTLVLSQEKPSNQKQVIYSMINYPNCTDKGLIFLPKNIENFKPIDFTNNLLMTNPYPTSRKDEKISLRFISSPIKIFNTNKEELSLNQDFDISTKFLLFSEGKEGNYSIAFTATREDPLDGKILGNTCKIPIYTPVCSPPCFSCNQTGNEVHDYCYGCKNESYYKTDFIDYLGEEFDKLHNCHKCNESCYSCNGPLILTRDKSTTNCQKCYYKDGFFPYENDPSLCISEDTQDYWEEILNYGIYLDKPDPSDNTTWVWKNCHYNCRKCNEKGDNDNNKCTFCRKTYFFYCDQTEENGGIPGSCHNDCENHGFYTIEKEKGRMKCCPCLTNCERCTNDTICNLCYENFFLTLDSRECVEHCDYCLAEIKSERKCVNCKDKGLFTLNKTCVNSTTPPPDNFPHHIIDEKCNLLIGCEEGCYNCSTWYTDHCTKCKSGYYKEDFFGVTDKEDYFRCFSKSTCQGLTEYSYNKDIRVGGVAIREDGEDVCLNCKLRNNSYRQPENDFYCGPKKDKTYVDIEPYNKLSDCYFRCKSCDDWGNSYFMNCTSCRDGANYEHVKYRAGYGNCYRKAHKCGIYPYYHDYDIAEAMGYDEDNCGENCDVCLYNFSCTERFPYFVYETHECVEYCPVTEVLGNKCNMNNTVAMIILLRNPFGLKNPYDFLNSTISIQQFISSSLFQYIAQSYNLDVSALSTDINNYIGNGKIYNLQESQVIVGNNITLELTTFKLELEKLIDKLGGGTTSTGVPVSQPTDTSIIDISECEAILKKKYGLSDEEDLMIIKGDLLKELTEDYLGNSVEYQIFSTSMGAFLPLTDCQEAGTTVSVTNPFNSMNLITQYQSKTGAVVINGYNAFDVYSPFYNDICTAFTNENGNDVLLDDRRKDYFDENINLCESGCKFVGYNVSTNMYTCICNIKVIPGEEAEEYTGDYVTNQMPEGFRDLVSKRSNIEVFKCASQVFSSKGQKKNFGSYILLAALASLIGVIVFHYVRERKTMDLLFDELSQIPNSIANPNPKGTKDDKKKDDPRNKNKGKNVSNEVREKENKGKTSKRILKNEKIPVENLVKDLKLTEDELNNASFQIANDKDRRTFLRYYWSLLKVKQLFIFTFYTSGDHILRSTKIALFILFVSFYLAFTALFFNDSIMRAIYIYKGNTDAAVHIPNIILSSLCCLVASLIIRFVSLNEREISKIIQLNNLDERKKLAKKMKQISKIKLIILYAISGVLIMLFWYYLSAFCAVFKNSQGHYFTNVLVSFIICNIWPCVTSLIPSFLRTKALQNKNETLYKISQIVAYF